MRGMLSLGMILGLVSLLLNTPVDYIRFQRVNMMGYKIRVKSSLIYQIFGIHLIIR